MRSRGFASTLGCFLLLLVAARADVVGDALTDLAGPDNTKQLLAVLALRTSTDTRIPAALMARAQDPQTTLSVRSACLKELTTRQVLQAEPLFLQIASNPQEPLAVRGPAMEGLMVVGKSKHAEFFVKLIREDKSRPVKEQAAMVLGALGAADPNVISTILPLLDDVTTAPYAIGALGLSRQTSAVPGLIKQLNNENASVRISVIQALASLGDRLATEPMMALLAKGGDDYQRVTLVAALGSLKDPKAVPTLAALAKDGGAPDSLRQRAIMSLGRINSPDALPVLIQLAGSPGQAMQLRQVAVGALGDFGDAAIPTLLESLSEKGLANEASLALSRITGRYLGTDKDAWTKCCNEYLQRKRLQPR